MQAVSDAERSARAAAGLPPDHLTTFDHFPFHFTWEPLNKYGTAITKQLNSGPWDGDLMFHRLSRALSMKAYVLANEVMWNINNVYFNDPRSRMRFGLEPKPSDVVLPAVSGDWPTDPCFFICCDEKFLRNYGNAFLLSISDHSPGVRVHLHLMDTTPEWEERAKRFNLNLSITREAARPFSESIGTPKNLYYGAIRLIRFAEMLERCPRAWMIDADSLATGDVSKLLSWSDPIALRVRAGRLEPWNQFSACLVMGSTESRPYFDRVANIIRADISTPWWGIDQYALFSAWLFDKPAIKLLGPDIAAVDDEPGLFWFTAGKKKETITTDSSAYATKYREYQKRL